MTLHKKIPSAQSKKVPIFQSNVLLRNCCRLPVCLHINDTIKSKYLHSKLSEVNVLSSSSSIMTSSVISAQNVPVHYGIRAPFIEKCMVHLSQTVHNTHILFLKNVFSPLCLVCLPYTGLQYGIMYIISF